MLQMAMPLTAESLSTEAEAVTYKLCKVKVCILTPEQYNTRKPADENVFFLHVKAVGAV